MSALVGRTREREELCAGLETTRQGRGSLVLVTGDAGIGKTRLAEALAEIAAERGFDVSWGSCREEVGTPVYWPWVQALRGLSRLRGSPPQGASGRDGTGEVTDFLPEHALLQSAERREDERF